MIFYFSATGNSKYVAERIASELNEQPVSIVDCVAKNEYSFDVSNGEYIGIVTPTYFWGLPNIVSDFLEKLTLTSCSYLFYISTYGTSTGQTGTFVNRYQNLNARFSVKMPDTWTPMFDLSNAEKVERKNTAAEVQIADIIERIKYRETGDFMRNKIPMFAVKPYYKTYDSNRKTDRFFVEDNCIGCGLCAKKCPINAIGIKDGKPTWTKDRCVMCLGCLLRCPKFSIQYGKNTKKHGQYLNPNTKV